MNPGNVRYSLHPFLLLVNFLLELNQITGIAALLTFPLDVEMVEAEEALYRKEQEIQAEAG
jgi:hypothetical protein